MEAKAYTYVLEEYPSVADAPRVSWWWWWSLWWWWWWWWPRDNDDHDRDDRCCFQGDDLKPNTWCQKMPRKICAPDNCNMVQVKNIKVNIILEWCPLQCFLLQGPESCRDKMMVSTIQKPEEHCELQPQRHCRLITKLVPHLTTKEVAWNIFSCF